MYSATKGALSLSARRAWIEILTSRLPRSGTASLSARRAWIEINVGFPIAAFLLVALRKESVDRNIGVGTTRDSLGVVALRKESVDRNGAGLLLGGKSCKSLSARRAWIEISVSLTTSHVTVVALRKESVDRNAGNCSVAACPFSVALRKESVDRNPIRPAQMSGVLGRSPQGERG